MKQVLVFGTKLNDTYIHNSDLVDIVTNVIKTFSCTAIDELPDMLKYNIFNGDCNPRYEDGDNQYSIKVSLSGEMKADIKSHQKISRVIYLAKQDHAAHLDRLTLYTYENFANKFTVIKPNSIDNIVFYTHRKRYTFMYENNTCYVDAGRINACPLQHPNDNLHFYFKGDGKSICRLVVPLTMKLGTIRKVVSDILPSNLKIR